MGTRIGWATFSGSDLSGGEFSTFDWRAANFTHCDLTTRSWVTRYSGVDLQGVKLDNYRASLLMERLGIAIIGYLQGAVNIPPLHCFFYPQASLKSGVWKFSTFTVPSISECVAG